MTLNIQYYIFAFIKGYEILEEKDVTFTEEMTREFYKHLEGSVNLKKFFKKP